jgi:hypothetical protein
MRLEDGPRPAGIEGEVPSDQAEDQQYDLASMLKANNKSTFKIEDDGNILNQQGNSIGSLRDGLVTMKPRTMNEHVAMLKEAGIYKVRVLPPGHPESKKLEDEMNRQLSLNVPSRDGSLGKAPAALAGKDLETIEALDSLHEQFLEKAFATLQSAPVKNSFENTLACLKDESVHSNPSLRKELESLLSSADFNAGLAVLKELAVSGSAEAYEILTRPLDIHDVENLKPVNILELVDHAKNNNLGGYVINAFGIEDTIDVLNDCKDFSMRRKPERTNGSEEFPETPATSRGDISSPFPFNVDLSSPFALRRGQGQRGRQRPALPNFSVPLALGDGGLTGQPANVPGADHSAIHGARQSLPREPQEGVFGSVSRTAAPAAPAAPASRDSGILPAFRRLVLRRGPSGR